jgi:kexin
MLYHKILALLVSFAFLPSGISSNAPRRPQPRTYDTHAYYTLELSPSTSRETAASIAEALGVEVVEPLGELAGHWLVRVEGRTHDHQVYARSMASKQDPIVKRWKELISSAAKRSLGEKRVLRSLTPLTLRQRAKRSHPPPSFTARTPAHARLLGAPGMPFPVTDDSEFLYAQNELHLGDPMLNQQWHLINQDIKEVELNVTGLWGRGITGDNVKVVMVDDGLDMESDDLKGNFVSFDANALSVCEL